MNPEGVLMKLRLDHGLDSALTDLNRYNLSRFIAMFNERNPNSKASLVGTFATSYGDDVVAKTLVTASTRVKTASIARKLRTEQLTEWMNSEKSADDVFTLLKLYDDGVLSLTSRKLEVLEDYIKLFNRGKSSDVTLLDVLVKGFGGEQKMEKLLAIAQHNIFTVRKAQELQIALWLKNRLQPRSVLKKLGFDKGVQTVLTNPNRDMLSTYISKFNDKYPNSMTSLTGVLSAYYGDIAVAKALVSAKISPNTKDIATKLQLEQIEGWMNQKKSADDVFALLNIKNDGVLSLRSRKLDTLGEYINVFNSKNPRKQTNLANVLSKGFGGEDKFALMVVRALRPPVPNEMLLSARKYEELLFKNWFNRDLDPMAILIQIFKVPENNLAGASTEAKWIVNRYKSFYNEATDIVVPRVRPRRSAMSFEFSFWDDDDSSDDSSEDSSEESTRPTPATAISTVVSEYRNWVGPWSISADPACYREAHIMDKCPSNYDRNDVTNTCWAECPLSYPVECGMECIRQNDDCGLETFNKISVIGVTALDVASMGIFGLVRYIRNIKTSDPQTTEAQLLAILYQSSNIVTDTPIAITNCLGKTMPPSLPTAKNIVSTSQYILAQVIANGDSIISSWKKFKAFLLGANFTEAANELNATEISSLESGMKSNSTCGADLKSLLDRTWMIVDQYRQEDPDISDGDIRLKISNSKLVLNDIPTVTNNCMAQMIAESTESTAYKTRETLRKTFGVVINDLISKGTSNNGTMMKTNHYAYLAIQKGMTVLSTSGWDPYDISTMLVAYVQTVCGPTQFMGEIDDGTEDATLGLHTIQKAFKGSTSSWKRVGDGAVIVKFKMSFHFHYAESASVPVDPY
ncbi:hypothetical protein PHPALM_30905 [Phytophthora palmivora]|uniref:Secreted RxLR effector peptide protein n=1 Tax=Phytophthora palmivora TaxID=4796 RepID=A0A2P4X3Y5_9STRA|nr:hypothetical protein PHPALM_30905 [Phytophthora palmivora]